MKREIPASAVFKGRGGAGEPDVFSVLSVRSHAIEEGDPDTWSDPLEEKRVRTAAGAVRIQS